MHDKDISPHLRHLLLEGKSALTIYHRERALARLAAALPVPLMQATADHLYEWRASLDVAPATAAGYISNVREFYAWATAKGYFDESPAAGLPVPKLPRRVPRPIATSDLLAALEAATARIRIWLVLAAWCGLRAKEIALLRVESIHLREDDPYLFIASDATKGVRERVVPLGPFAAAEIAAFPLPASGYAFRKVDGRPLRPWLVSKLANNHLHELGIAATLHQLRHWFGTEGYASTLDLRALQEVMGHANVQTTAGYAAYHRASGRAIVDALPAPEPRKMPGAA